MQSEYENNSILLRASSLGEFFEKYEKIIYKAYPDHSLTKPVKV